MHSNIRSHNSNLEMLSLRSTKNAKEKADKQVSNYQRPSRNNILIKQSQSQVQSQMQQNKRIKSHTGLPPSQRHFKDNSLQSDQTVWYKNFCRFKYLTNLIPADLPMSKESFPYRLVISGISNLPSGKKSANSDLHISINATLFLIKNSENKEAFPISQTYSYICQEPINDKIWKHEYPIVFYYHSKIDKNSKQFSTKLVMNFCLKEIKGSSVQNVDFIGVAVLDAFQQCDYGDVQVNLFKGNEVEIVSSDLKKLSGNSVTSINLIYSISSYLEIKKIAKFIPANSIFSCQDKISGIYGDYLPNSKNIVEVFQASGYDIKIKTFQVQIPQKFQDQILRVLREIPTLQFKDNKLSQKNWKVACGFHNEYKAVSLSTRKLSYVQKQTTGAWKVSVFDALGQDQILSIPYYKSSENYQHQKSSGLQGSLFVISLMYVIESQRASKQYVKEQIQIGFFAFRPILTGNSDQLSEPMICQSGMGVYNRLLGVYCDRLPTVIVQYQSEQMEDFNQQEQIKGQAAGQMQHFGNSRSRIKSKPRISTYLGNDMRERQQLLEEIQRERLKLEKDKQTLQRMKTQNYVVFQQDFQKRFNEQKENLAKRQQMLENQYRTEVQKQIQAKMEMQNQIRHLKEMIAGFQTNPNARSKKISYEDSINEDYQRQKYRLNVVNQRYDSPRASMSQKSREVQRVQRGQRYQNPQIHIHHKIDPSYFVDPQPNIPASKLRQILKANQPINLQQDYANYHSASKFTVSFSAVKWNQNMVPPSNIFAIIYFFNFREFKTEVMSYQEQLDLLDMETHQRFPIAISNRNKKTNTLSKDAYVRLITRNSSLAMQNSQPSYAFTVDSSLHTCPPIFQEDLINYLANNCMIIDFVDADSHIYLGQINIKLRQLLRGKKKQTLIAKQYAIRKQGNPNSISKGKFSSIGNSSIGNIHILIKNQEIPCKDVIKNTNRLTVNKTQKEVKRKIVSNIPINLKNKTESDEGMPKNDDKKMNRQEIRIQNFKKAQQANRALPLNQFQNVPQNEKPRALNSIKAYKEKKLPNYLKQIYSSLLSSHVKISTHYGKSQTFVHEFVNNSINSGSFKVVIDSGNINRGNLSSIPSANRQEKSKQKQQSFLQVVCNSVEWKYFAKKYKYQQPKSFQMINQSNVFYLNAGESLPILFRYLSFSGVEQDILTFNVTIIKDDSLLMVDGFTVEILHHQQITHHSYTFYEPGEQTIDLIVPVVYSPSSNVVNGNSSSSHRMLYLTKENISAQWISEYQILVRLNSPRIMESLQFNLLLYSDQHFDTLLQNWLIKVHSYQGVYTMSRVQGNTKFKLMLPEMYSTRTDLLNLFSSNDRLVISRQFGRREIWCELGVQFQEPQENNKIELRAKNIEVTCVDISRMTLVYGWVIQILPYILRRV